MVQFLLLARCKIQINLTALMGSPSPLQSLHGILIPDKPQLPKFYTKIDEVDLSVNICGLK